MAKSGVAWRGFAPAVLLAMLASSAVAADATPAPSFKHGQWPFLPLARPQIPETADDGWARNVIDRYVSTRLAEQGLRPSDQADKSTLLRRVTFDLTGLPPTPAEQAAFLADDSPAAYEAAVDRLLASPAYGERWAQHWLDLVRYAESDGFKEDAHRPAAFRYRDYVIDAINADLPYDRFLSQQLAGDELEPENPAALVATGFLRLYPDEYNAANVRQRRQEILDDITGTTGVVFLGLTMGCAKCHDHKFDEVLQADYFRLQAFFTPLVPRDDLPLASAEQRREYEQKQAAWEEATRELRAEIERLVGPERVRLRDEALEKFDQEIRDAIVAAPEARSPRQRQLAAQAVRFVESKERGASGQLKGDAKQKYEALAKQLAAFDGQKPAPLPKLMAATDAGNPPPATFLLVSGHHERPGDEVRPGYPAFLGGVEANVQPVATAWPSTGRRAALARWLVEKDHPLTARLIVNRIWQHHFGEGIVPTPNDFGAMGDAPSHPELLDQLACDLVDSGWSLKQLHRQMVLSATYRQSSRYDASNSAHAAAMAADPENRLLWRARRRRLEGEAIRDAMLHVSSQLHRRMHGASARPALPDGLAHGDWNADKAAEDRNRRSVYLLVKRNLRYPLFEAFDQPDLHNSCARRTTTITAPQALALWNGELAREASHRWAERFVVDHADDAALAEAAYIESLGRAPTDSERVAATEFLAASAARDGGPHARAAAAADLCHVLFNCNEFVYVD